ncbi:MAG: right-handed parallel beta-helix repeat-containing protein [Methanobrevibacter sp.]|jgi:hypothetical protein|nr:right-handed parallel beta-helix repeat-containing protein [Candidatus Methanoflexus mossambicus]
MDYKKKYMKKFLILFSIVSFILFMGSVSAVDTHINANNGTIQDGIDKSVDNDNNIYIADGVYKGLGNVNLTITGKNITIQGQSKAKTIIDGEGVNWLFNVSDSNYFRLKDITLFNFTTSGNTTESFGIKNTGDNFLISNVLINESHPQKGDKNPVKPKLVYNTGDNFLIENSEILNPGGFAGPSITVYNSGKYFTVDNLTMVNPNRYGIDNYGDYFTFKNSNFYNLIPDCTSSMTCCPYQSDANHSLIINSTFSDFPCCPVAFDGNNITVDNCKFYRNSEAISSGAKFVTVKNSYFEANFDAAIANNIGADNLLVLNCTFRNSSDSVINNAQSATPGQGGNNITVKDSIIELSNRAIKNAGNDFTVINTKFIKNFGDYGAAIFNTGNNFIVRDCLFELNNATSGGAISQENGSMEIYNSIFENNIAEDGSAILIEGGVITISSSKFENNKASNRGTIAVFDGANLIFDKSSVSTFKNNKISSKGNGRNIYLSPEAKATIPTSLKVTTLSSNGNYLKVKGRLVDIAGDILNNKKISLKIAGKTVSLKTNSKGIVEYKYTNLKKGKLNIQLTFNGESSDISYLSSKVVKSINLKSKFVASFKDKVSKKTIQRTYTITNKGNLKASFTASLKIPNNFKLISVSGTKNKVSYKYLSSLKTLKVSILKLNPNTFAKVVVTAKKA